MANITFQKPLLLGNYSVWCDPPDETGTEAMHFVSAQRSIKLKGRAFRELERRVFPLLNGRSTIAQIESAVADVFEPADLHAGLGLLAEQGLLGEGAGLVDQPWAERLAPQLGYFHELTGDGAGVQDRLARATVTVLGLGGAGASVALGLAVAGVGRLRCADVSTVTPADVYLAGYAAADVGRPRAQALAARIAALSPAAAAGTPRSEGSFHQGPFSTEDDLAALIRGSEFVVCCLDRGQSNLIFKLNRACLAAAIRWTSCTLAGAEVVVGPTVEPHRSACYLCYRMRAVACAGNPEDAFAYEQQLDRQRRDGSDRREGLVFAAGLAANLLGLEALRALAHLGRPVLIGKARTFDLVSGATDEHVVLRKPMCAACLPDAAAAQP